MNGINSKDRFSFAKGYRAPVAPQDRFFGL